MNIELSNQAYIVTSDISGQVVRRNNHRDRFGRNTDQVSGRRLNSGGIRLSRASVSDAMNGEAVLTAGTDRSPPSEELVDGIEPSTRGRLTSISSSSSVES